MKEVIYLKKILILLVSVVVMIGLGGCYNNDSESADSSIEYLHKSAAAEVTEDHLLRNSEEYKSFMEKLELFAFKLTVEIYNDTNKTSNLSISPISIYMALAMAISGSDGATKNEMLDAVGVTEEEVLEFTKYLYAFTNSVYYDDEKKVAAISELSNSIWIDNNISLKEKGINVLAESFNADSYYVPFYDDNSAANKAFADYVKSKSRGLIEKPASTFKKETLFVLANTYYMKEVWNEYGNDLKSTKDSYDFINNDGSVIKEFLLESPYTVGKMYETESFSHYYAQTDHGYKIKFIVPKDGYALEDVFTVENLVSINCINSYVNDWEEGYCYNTRVLFPAFEAEYSKNIKSILENKFNIRTLFSDYCDMSNLSDEDMICSAVIHQSKLKVDKSGIEGAALTYLPMTANSAPAPTVEVYLDYIVDRAFGYVLTGCDGTILFSGVVNTI